MCDSNQNDEQINMTEVIQHDQCAKQGEATPCSFYDSWIKAAPKTSIIELIWNFPIINTLGRPFICWMGFWFQVLAYLFILLLVIKGDTLVQLAQGSPTQATLIMVGTTVFAALLAYGCSLLFHDLLKKLNSMFLRGDYFVSTYMGKCSSYLERERESVVKAMEGVDDFSFSNVFLASKTQKRDLPLTFFSFLIIAAMCVFISNFALSTLGEPFILLGIQLSFFWALYFFAKEAELSLVYGYTYFMCCGPVFSGFIILPGTLSSQGGVLSAASVCLSIGSVILLLLALRNLYRQYKLRGGRLILVPGSKTLAILDTAPKAKSVMVPYDSVCEVLSCWSEYKIFFTVQGKELAALSFKTRAETDQFLKTTNFGSKQTPAKHIPLFNFWRCESKSSLAAFAAFLASTFMVTYGLILGTFILPQLESWSSGQPDALFNVCRGITRVVPFAVTPNIMGACAALDAGEFESALSLLKTANFLSNREGVAGKLVDKFVSPERMAKLHNIIELKKNCSGRADHHYAFGQKLLDTVKKDKGSFPGTNPLFVIKKQFLISWNESRMKHLPSAVEYLKASAGIGVYSELVNSKSFISVLADYNAISSMLHDIDESGDSVISDDLRARLYILCNRNSDAAKLLTPAKEPENAMALENLLLWASASRFCDNAPKYQKRVIKLLNKVSVDAHHVNKSKISILKALILSAEGRKKDSLSILDQVISQGGNAKYLAVAVQKMVLATLKDAQINGNEPISYSKLQKQVEQSSKSSARLSDKRFLATNWPSFLLPTDLAFMRCLHYIETEAETEAEVEADDSSDNSDSSNSYDNSASNDRERRISDEYGPEFYDEDADKVPEFFEYLISLKTPEYSELAAGYKKLLESKTSAEMVTSVEAE